MGTGLRTRWLAALGGFALVAAIAFSAPAAAEEPGDEISVTLTSGKTFEGTLVSRDSKYLKIKMGSYEIDLPSRLVDTVKVKAPRKKPEPESGSGAAKTAPAADDGEPEPSVITLKDGRKIKGWVVKKDGENTWVVFGSVHGLLSSQIESVEGGQQLVEAGEQKPNAADPASRIEMLGSKNKNEMLSASSTLRVMGMEALEELLGGLEHENPLVRVRCIELVSRLNTNRFEEPFISLLGSDPDDEVRSAVAYQMSVLGSDDVKKALMKSASKDSSDEVRSASLYTLRRKVNVRDTQALMRILSFLKGESTVVKPLCNALRAATGKQLDPDKETWIDWWETKGGRLEIQDRIDALNNEG